MALTKIDDRGLKTPIDLLDNEKIRFGTGNDLEILHDGTESWIYNNTGALTIRSTSTGTDVKIQTNGPEQSIWAKANGGVELYYDNAKKFETRSDGAEVTGHLYLGGDNNTIILGNDSDMQLWHSGTHGYIYNKTGWGLLRSDNWQICDKEGVDVMANFKHDGAVELYHDNVKKFETISQGIQINGYTSIEANTSLHYFLEAHQTGSGNGCQIRFRNDHEDQCFVGLKGDTTGDFRIYNEGKIRLEHGSDQALVSNQDGALELYYDNSKKFETTSAGITVTGEAKFASRRTYAGQLDTGTSNNWWKIGTISTFGGGNAAKITILGTNSYGPDDNISGETTIILRRDNGTRVRGYFYGSGTTNSYLTIAEVATKATSNSNEFDIWVLPGGHYQNIAAFVDISSGAATWTDAPSDTGSATQPASSYALQKDWVLKTGGVDRLKVDSAGGVTVEDGNLIIGTAGHGIDFSAVGGPLSGSTANSQLFEDYERGSWTMGFEYYNTTTSAWTTVPFDNSPDYSSFDYVKCGHLVHVWGYTGGFNVGSAAVNMSARLTGLPYAAVWSQPYYGATCIFTHTSAFGSSGNVEYVATGYTPYNLAVLYPMRPKTDQIACWIDGDKTFMFSATYETAS